MNLRLAFRFHNNAFCAMAMKRDVTLYDVADDVGANDCLYKTILYLLASFSNTKVVNWPRPSTNDMVSRTHIILSLFYS